MIQQTSIRAFREISEEINDRQAKVYNTIALMPKINNTEIAKYLKKPINTITPRVHELRKKGLIKQAGTKKCPITNKTTMAWEIE